MGLEGKKIVLKSGTTITLGRIASVGKAMEVVNKLSLVLNVDVIAQFSGISSLSEEERGIAMGSLLISNLKSITEPSLISAVMDLGGVTVQTDKGDVVFNEDNVDLFDLREDFVFILIEMLRYHIYPFFQGLISVSKEQLQMKTSRKSTSTRKVP